MGIVKIIIYLILTVSGLTLFKLGSNQLHIELSMQSLGLKVPMLVIIGTICYGGSFLLWLNIIKDNEISSIFPIVTSLVTILIFFSGVVIFKESVTMPKIIGVSCILIGIIVMNILK